MCGLVGFLKYEKSSPDELQSAIAAMSGQLAHRGPDDAGTWVDGEVGMAVGFRRLAILDLSAAGRQPMVSLCGRYVIVFNGEIYNFRDLRGELEVRNHRFRGHSDTEVMLAGFCEWGLEAAVRKFIGMFAFAVWDRRERTLHLVRDRLGIKPLYYGWAKKTFMFTSELKALRAYPCAELEINRDALALQMRLGYIPQPYSIYKRIFKVPPGCVLTLHYTHSPYPGQEKICPFWSAKEAAEKGAANGFRGSDLEAVEQLDALLRDVVRSHMVADVPLGAFLSGGIDSSTVVALMQAQSTGPTKTFTVGFHENHYNEANYARAVAAYLGTDHTELYVSPQEAMAVIPQLPVLYDEPFSDVSQIPTYLISALARRQVTVSLSGDGGDELFGGYTRYLLASSVWKRIKWLPSASRRVLGRLIKAVRPETYSHRLGWLRPWFSKYGSAGPVGDKLYKLAEVIDHQSPERLYYLLLSHWKEPDRIVLGGKEPTTLLDDRREWARLPEFSDLMMFLDLVSYLPDDILTKVDRASMGVSLEARVPLLDHRVVEFAARLPLALKIRNGQGKWLLRQLLNKYVPNKLTERHKMGFGVPIGDWVRGPLRNWAEDLLDESRLSREGFLNPKPIRAVWAEHLAGQRDWQYQLWDVLMFQAWLAANKTQKVPTEPSNTSTASME